MPPAAAAGEMLPWPLPNMPGTAAAGADEAPGNAAPEAGATDCSPEAPKRPDDEAGAAAAMPGKSNAPAPLPPGAAAPPKPAPATEDAAKMFAAVPAPNPPKVAVAACAGAVALAGAPNKGAGSDGAADDMPDGPRVPGNTIGLASGFFATGAWGPPNVNWGTDGEGRDAAAAALAGVPKRLAALAAPAAGSAERAGCAPNVNEMGALAAGEGCAPPAPNNGDGPDDAVG